MVLTVKDFSHAKILSYDYYPFLIYFMMSIQYFVSVIWIREKNKLINKQVSCLIVINIANGFIEPYSTNNV